MAAAVHHRDASLKTMFTESVRLVKLGSSSSELLRLCGHSFRQSFVFAQAVLRGVLPNILGDFHAAEVRPAHRTKVCGLSSFLRQRFVMKFTRGLGIERQIELILPSELEARFRTAWLTHSD